MADGYEFLREAREASILELDDDEMVTRAFDSIAPSATANPSPACCWY